MQGIIGPVQVDFGNKETGVEINSVEESVIEILDIAEQTESEKVFSESPEIQSFSEAWELIDWGEINNIPENEKIEWTYVEWDFDINSIVAPEIDDIIQTGSEEDEEPTEVQEVFIDGAEKPKWVEINSISENEGEYTDIEVQNADDTASGTTDEAQISESNPQWFTWFGLLSATQADTNWLIAEYLFEWNANDTGPNWFHGTIYSAQLTQGKDWVNNTAYNFDGQNDGIVLNGMAGQITTWEFSLDMWVNVADLNSNISWYRDSSFKWVFFFGLNPYFRLVIDNNNRLALWQKVWWGWHSTTSQSQIPTNQWMHIAATHNKETREDSIYINGQKVNSSSTSSNGNFDVYVGAKYENSLWARKYGSYQTNTNFFNGKLDEVRLYNKSLTQEQVSNLYQHGTPYTPVIPEAEPVVEEVIQETVEENPYVIKSFISHQDAVTINNQNEIAFTLRNVEYQPYGKETIEYSYSLDGDHYQTIEGTESNIKVSSVWDYGTGMTQEEEPNIWIQNVLQANADGLLAEYLFEWNANDTGPNALHGNVNNVTLSTWHDGAENSAYKFLEGHIDLPQNIQATSLSFWASKDTTDDTGNMWFTPRWAIPKYIWQVHSNGNVYVDQWNGWRAFPHGLTTSDEWVYHHWALVVEGWYLKLYKDGEYISQSTNTTGLLLGRIGRWNDYFSGRYTYDGNIDNIRIYNKPLTVEQIQNLYEHDSLTETEQPLATSPLVEEEGEIGDDSVVIASLNSTQAEITLENQRSVDFALEGVSYLADEVSYSYSFDGTNYIDLPKTEWVQISSFLWEPVDSLVTIASVESETSTGSESIPEPEPLAWIWLQSVINTDSDGLIAEYLFEWNANDTGPNNYNGTLYGATLTSWKNNESDSAYHFDGQDDGIVLNSMVEAISTWEYGVSMWVNIDDLNSQLWIHGDSRYKGSFFFGLNPYFRLGIWTNDTLTLSQKIGSSWYKTQSQGILPTQEWMHIVATHSKETRQDTLYINGEQVNTSTTSSNWDYVSYLTSQHENSLWARKYGAGYPNTNFFKGILDDVRIYNKNLTPEKVQDLYNEWNEEVSTPTRVETSHEFNLDLSSQADGEVVVYAKANDGTKDSNIVTLTLQKQTAVTPVPDNSLQKIFTSYDFQLDLSDQPDGEITLYAKVGNSWGESTPVTLTLSKDTYVLTAPTNFIKTEVQSDQATYSWTDTNNAPYNETKYILRDGNNNIIQDDIESETLSYTETGLNYNTAYQRKICAVSEQWEECSTLTTFITPYPEAKEYSFITNPGNKVNIYMPISNYRVEEQYDILVDGERSTLWEISGNVTYNILHIWGQREWKVTLYMKEKWAAYTKYIINIEVKIPEISHTFYVSERINALFYKHDHRLYDSSIIRIESGKYINGLKPGTTTISSYSNSILTKIHHITVLPIPDPQHIYATTEVWKRLSYQWSYQRWYSYTQSKNGVIQIDAWPHTMQVNAQASGTATIYITSPIWRYITHIYHITINPKPVQYFTCSVPLWHECETYWYPEDEWYSYTVTNPGVVELDNKRHYYAALDERYSLLHIEWLQEWATFIYIHKNWDHVATIHTTIEAPVEAIRVENSDFDNKEWETTVTKIISWWWGYKVHEVNREELSV